MRRCFTNKMSFAVLAFILLSCKDSSVLEYAPGDNTMVFEMEYVNRAWGFAYHGTMIDQDGGMYSYNPGKDIDSVLYHADGYYSAQELYSKYQHGKTYLRRIPGDTVEWSRDLACRVILNNFSDTLRVGADMGSLNYSVYVYRKEYAKYQKVILKVEGDFVFYNTSESAVALVAWMKNV